MQTTREMPPNPSTPGPADIPLAELPRCGHGTASPSAGRASLSASSFADDARSGHHETGSAVPSTEVARPGKNPVFYYFTRLALFWTTYIRCTVNFSACRDHLAVERTFLGYLRTSTVLAMFGTLVAQLYTINPQDHGLGRILLGKPLAMVFFALAIVTVVLGAARTFRHQQYLIKSKALAGGFEPTALGGLLLALLLACFGITLAMDSLPVSEKG